MKKYLAGSFTFILALFLSFPQTVFGQSPTPNAVKFTLINPGFKDLGSLVGILIQVIELIAGLFFLAQLLIAGISWIGAGGDPKAITSARDRITNAIMGLVLVAATYAIILVVEKVLGISIVSGFKIS